jgi:hypothetical protein
MDDFNSDIDGKTIGNRGSSIADIVYDDDIGVNPNDRIGGNLLDDYLADIDWNFDHEALKDWADDPNLFGGASELGQQVSDLFAGSPSAEQLKTIDDIVKAGNNPAAVQEIVNKAGPDFGAALKALLFDPKGGLSGAGMLALGMGAYGLSKSSLTQPSGGIAGGGGYQGGVPTYTAVRKAVEQPEYVPYSGKPVMGRRRFTDTQYVSSKKPEDVTAAEEKAKTQAGILAKYEPKIADTTKKGGIADTTKKGGIADTTGKGGIADTTGKGGIATTSSATASPSTLIDPQNLMSQQRGIVAAENYPAPTEFVGPTTNMDTGPKLLIHSNNFPLLGAGTELASGGVAALRAGRYLRGGTDGMADKIPSSIDNKQPAKLSHGEFVIPADVVSHLGNGNSDAGAKVLYDMMAKVRKARTGNAKQGKRINPSKFVPGGIVGYNAGGAVAFTSGGATSSGTTADAIKTLSTSSNPTVSSNSLSEWAGPTVTDMLARGKALAAEPYQEYKGALSAGTSPLQSTAFTNAENISGSTFDANAAAKYMNPYIQTALMPQLDEMRRQSQINMQQLGGIFGGKGALGGARNQIVQSEGIRNLLDKQTAAIGSAYSSAFDKAMGQYNTEQNQEIADLKALLDAGATQRQIEQEGITADKAQFEEERQDPFTKLLFEQSLLKGLPLGTTTSGQELSDLQRFGQSAGQVGALYDLASKFFGPKK